MHSKLSMLHVTMWSYMMNRNIGWYIYEFTFVSWVYISFYLSRMIPNTIKSPLNDDDILSSKKSHNKIKIELDCLHVIYIHDMQKTKV